MIFDKIRSESIAQELLGMEFEVQARGENKKMDCYGVLLYFYGQFGVNLPDYLYQDDWGANEELVLREYATFFRKLAREETPETGDMIIIINSKNSASHLGVCLPGNRFVHSYFGIGTKIDRWTDSPWKEKVYGFFRLINVD